MKIVITGGPGGGKTTALDLFKRELLGRVITVPESATAIFESGVKRDYRKEVLMAIQKAIFDYQKNIEIIYRAQHPDKIMLCDRGTLDGLAYWPNSTDSFFSKMNTTFIDEMNEYNAVIFFETAAKSDEDITTNNPYRNESNEMAIQLDKKLQEIWNKHPHFYIVKSNGSFVDKIMNGITIIKQVIDKQYEIQKK